MRVRQAKLTTLFGPYANGSNQPFTITARRAYDRLVTKAKERDLSMLFTSLTAKVVTTVCALVGALALLGCFSMTVTGGSPYLEFALAMVFFVMFLVGSYWWMVFGPGRGL